MNKKRLSAIGISIIIFVVAIIVPEYKTQMRGNISQIENIIGNYQFMSEEILESNDANKRIAILELDGTIMSGGSDFQDAYDHEFFLNQLDAIIDDDTVKGVFLMINSPGGGVYEASEIRERILKIKEKEIPIYVSMLSMAASGGYYIAADATKIFATEETVTGSIGVITQTPNYKELADKLGVKNYTYKSGAMKDMGSSLETPTEEEQKIWQSIVDDSFNRFVQIVANGRNMQEDEVRKIADGRIYTANQALKIGLIDEIGFKEDAFNALVEENDLEDATIFRYQNDSQDDFLNMLSPFFYNANERIKTNIGEQYFFKMFDNYYLRPLVLWEGK